MVGNVFSNIAIPWFVLETTGSAAKTGLAAFFTLLPAILASFFGGALVDRVGFKRMSILSDLASSLAVAAIPLLYTLDRLDFWYLLMLVFLGALLDAPGTTARSALVPDVAQHADMQLERATSLMQAIQRGSTFVGAPLAGVIVAIWSTESALWLNALSFVLSAAIIAVGVPRQTSGEEPDADVAPQAYLKELLDGWRFIASDPLVRAIVLTVMITNFLDAPIFAVVLPVYASDILGSAFALGLMIAAFGGGALVGALLFGAIGHKLSRRLTFIGSFIVVGVPFWILAAAPSLPIAVTALTVGGIAAGPLNPLMQTIGYERIPAGMRGRVFGTITAGAYIAMPLGVLLAGYALEWLELRITLLIIATCYLVTTVSLLFNPGIREMGMAPSGEDVTDR